MARCWTCGSHIEKPLFTCPACRTVEEIQDLRQETAASLLGLAEIQRHGFEQLSHALSEGLSEIASAIEWGFEEIIWQLQQQTAVLQSINSTLKTPNQTQANEWRQMAEELRSRAVLDKSEKFFLKAVEANPLDYRTYVGLAEAYLQMDKFDEAKSFLEQSLPHAPKGSRSMKRVHTDSTPQEMLEATRRTMRRESMRRSGDSMKKQRITTFDYRSYSYRLIGHIYACKEEYAKAVSTLRSAIELSPNYYEAVYDLAQYSAQIRDRDTCLSALKSLIQADSFYFYLTQKERNFEPLSVEVASFLDEINSNVNDRARKEIQKTEQMIRLTEVSIGKAQEILTTCPNKQKLLARSTETLEDAQSKLRLAKDKVDRRDYRAALEAVPICEEASDAANSAKKGAHEATEHYKIEHARRKKFVTGEFIYGTLLGPIFGAFITGLAGCAVGVFSKGISVASGIIGGGILGAIGGLIFGIVEATLHRRKLKNKPY